MVITNSLEVPIELTAYTHSDSTWSCWGGSPAIDTPYGLNGAVVPPGDSITRIFGAPLAHRGAPGVLTFGLVTHDVGAHGSSGLIELGMQKYNLLPSRGWGVISPNLDFSCTGTEPMTYRAPNGGGTRQATIAVECGSDAQGPLTAITLRPASKGVDDAAE